MTFSPLVDKQLVTDKRSSRYGASITRVIVHHWAGTNGGVERLVQSSDLASANYIILSDGTLIGSVPEEYQAWTSGSQSADQPSITFEVQNSEVGGDWPVSDSAIATLTKTIADIAKRYGWGSVDRNRVRGHREFYATSCPGPYLYARLSDIAHNANALLAGGSVVSKEEPKITDKSIGCVDKRVIKVSEVQTILKSLGLYDREIDEIDGDATRIAIGNYQRSQRYFPNMVVDGIWGSMTNDHYKWVKKLQANMNEWKTADRIGATEVDGSFGEFGVTLCRQIQLDNFAGAYQQAVTYVYGRGSVAAADGLPGKAFCVMLGMDPHPAL